MQDDRLDEVALLDQPEGREPLRRQHSLQLTQRHRLERLTADWLLPEAAAAAATDAIQFEIVQVGLDVVVVVIIIVALAALAAGPRRGRKLGRHHLL